MKKKKQTKKKQNLTSNSKIHSNFSKKFWMYLGYISIIIAIVVFAFQIGNYFGYKNAKKDEFKNFYEYLTQIKKGINLSTITCNKKVLIPSETVEIKFNINNTTPYECDLWIGASAINSSGKEIWNRHQDKTITITSNGITSATRNLTFPVNCLEDVYDIQINVWYGKKGDPSQSELISSAALRDQILIKKTLS